MRITKPIDKSVIRWSYLIRPRWHKMFSDLIGNLSRSFLVIISIAVGLFAIGMIATLDTTLAEDIVTSYRSINPANITVSINEMDKKEIDSVRRIEGVHEAEGARVFSLRLKSGTNEWTRINLKAIPDFENTTINRLLPIDGEFIPKEKQIIFDLHKLSDAHIQMGDMVELILPDGTKKKLHFVGVVRDQSIGSLGEGGYFTAPLTGYIEFGTLPYLAQPQYINQVYATVDPPKADDLSHIQSITDLVVEKLEKNNHPVLNQFNRLQNQHPNKIYLEAMSSILLGLGFFVVLLSTFLITNTLSALLNQQKEQIGIMKTYGGRSIQIIAIYSVLILIYSAIGLILSLSFSGAAAFGFLNFLSHQVNFVPSGYREVPLAIILQVVLAAIVPLTAGFFPILKASRIPIIQALDNTSGETTSANSTSRIDYWIGKSHLPRPVLLSIRNTFRQKGRLALTLATLTLGGAIFIATFNVQTSMKTYIQSVSKYFVADLNLILDKPYRIEDLQIALSNLPQVAKVEGWASAQAELLKDSDKPGESISLLAPPADSSLISPNMIKGRWILKGDENAIVLNEAFLNHYPHLKVGDTFRLRVNGDKTTWVIVGFFQFAGKPAGFFAYANYDYLAKITHQTDKAYDYHIVAQEALTTIEEQKALGRIIEEHLEKLGYQINDISPGYYLLQSATSGLDTLVIFLVVMATLSAIVGSIGLTGTLSMNVMERIREIGIMRAIGANNKAMMQMIIIEGLTIGFISWVLGSLISLPISRLLWAAISNSLFGFHAQFSLNSLGFILWAGVVLFLTILASLMPASHAARMTIREALAYE